MAVATTKGADTAQSQHRFMQGHGGRLEGVSDGGERDGISFIASSTVITARVLKPMQYGSHIMIMRSARKDDSFSIEKKQISVTIYEREIFTKEIHRDCS